MGVGCLARRAAVLNECLRIPTEDVDLGLQQAATASAGGDVSHGNIQNFHSFVAFGEQSSSHSAASLCGVCVALAVLDARQASLDWGILCEENGYPKRRRIGSYCYTHGLRSRDVQLSLPTLCLSIQFTPWYSRCYSACHAQRPCSESLSTTSSPSLSQKTTPGF